MGKFQYKLLDFSWECEVLLVFDSVAALILHFLLLSEKKKKKKITTTKI